MLRGIADEIVFLLSVLLKSKVKYLKRLMQISLFELRTRACGVRFIAGRNKGQQEITNFTARRNKEGFTLVREFSVLLENFLS